MIVHVRVRVSMSMSCFQVNVRAMKIFQVGSTMFLHGHRDSEHLLGVVVHGHRDSEHLKIMIGG